MFGYAFHELVVADRRLQFGWRSSPAFFCMFSAALEHAHRHTSYDDAVVMGAGVYRDGACLGHPTERNRSAGFVATWLSGPPAVGEGGGGPPFSHYTT